MSNDTPSRVSPSATRVESDPIKDIAAFRGGQLPLLSGDAKRAAEKILNAAELLADHSRDLGYCEAKDAGNKAAGRILQAGEDLGRIRSGLRELIVALRADR